MKEYVLRICVRDSDHPLDEKVILESGYDVKHPDSLAKAMEGLTGLLRIYITPEKAVQHLTRLKRQEKLIQAKLIVRG